jgi:hypothetical protein
MSELVKSVEKSISFLKERYPEDLPLLTDLGILLKLLKEQKENTSVEIPTAESPE